MNRKILWMLPIFIFAVACSDLNNDRSVSDPHTEASAENQGTSEQSELSDEEQLWEYLYQNNSDEAVLNEMKKLFSEGVSPNTVNDDDITPITYAVMEGDQKLVEFLLQNGVEVHDHEESDHQENDEWNHEKNENLLEIAVEQESNEIIDLLLKMGAHFEIGNEQMLAIAVQEEKPELIKILLHNGYNPNLEMRVDEQDFTLLNYSIMEDNEEITTLLLNAGANPNFAANNGEVSALVTAIIQEKPTELVSLLLGRGADANARYEGKPLLFEAIKQDHPSLVEALLVAGALPFSIEESEAAYELAEESDQTKVADLLQQYGW
ncbi:ankyrin repeat domain-containing protein [Pseudalkalibacillus hwajinpoensis]|uniref:ankyrin repeat domain-containing protein n=1 Tax=Guptibacillus hwajinpoensis TaxID=208199 RepID=UPI001CFF15D4|nr:ankyrin repeat domain-containing protein [Pseudalkalibacillus hwajinpoensis]